MGRIERSWALAKESLKVLRRTPSLVWFPVLSGLAAIGVTVSFVLPVFLATNGKDLEKIDPVVGYPLLAAYYFLSYFVVIFFNAGLVACAHESLMGKETTFGDGLRAAVRRLPAILGWTLIAATVGTILQMISERSGLIGKIVVAILGAAWNLVSYFVIPIVVVERGSPIAALKKSSSMLKATWGENLIGNAGIGFVYFLLALAPIPVVVLAFFLSPIAGAAALGVMLLYWLILAVIGASVSGVYQTALYVYATTGEAPQGFSQDSIANAFVQKPEGFGSRIRRRF